MSDELYSIYMRKEWTIKMKSLIVNIENIIEINEEMQTTTNMEKLVELQDRVDELCLSLKEDLNHVLGFLENEEYELEKIKKNIQYLHACL